MREAIGKLGWVRRGVDNNTIYLTCYHILPSIKIPNFPLLFHPLISHPLAKRVESNNRSPIRETGLGPIFGGKPLIPVQMKGSLPRGVENWYPFPASAKLSNLLICSSQALRFSKQFLKFGCELRVSEPVLKRTQFAFHYRPLTFNAWWR